MKSWVQTIKNSFKTDEHDFTKIDISEAVILLSIPMILELSLESIFAVVDMYFVSRLGQNAISTVGLTESIVTIIYSLAIGISTGATAIVARRVGENNIQAAEHSATQAIFITLVISFILGIFGFFFSQEVLQFMGARPEVITEGHRFTQIMLTANLPILLLFLINGIFRGAGDAAIAMRSLWAASATNIILCPLFIYKFGLVGAAYATVLGRSTGVVYQIIHLMRGSGLIKLKFKTLSMDWSVIKSILKIASPASMQFIIGSGSWIILTKLVSESGGTQMSAAFQIAFRNFVFFILPAWGMSNAVATLVGQNLGAKQEQRADESIWITLKYSIYMMLSVSALVLVSARSIVEFFTADPELIVHATQALRIIGSGYVFYGMGMVFTQALNGAGDTKIPTWINFWCFWVFQTPLAYAFIKFGFGPMGALLSIPISHALLAVFSYLYVKKGKWKSLKV